MGHPRRSAEIPWLKLNFHLSELSRKPRAALGRPRPGRYPAVPTAAPAHTAVSRLGDPPTAPAKPGFPPASSRYLYFPTANASLSIGRREQLEGGPPVRGPADGSLPSERPLLPLGLPRLQGTRTPHTLPSPPGKETRRPVLLSSKPARTCSEQPP